jgi:hypothetical protein
MGNLKIYIFIPLNLAQVISLRRHSLNSVNTSLSCSAYTSDVFSANARLLVCAGIRAGPRDDSMNIGSSSSHIRASVLGDIGHPSSFSPSAMSEPEASSIWVPLEQSSADGF